jgi:predicted CXXCH cytochrome family protein
MAFRLPGLGPESFVGRAVTRAAGGRLSPRGLRLASFGAALALGLGLVAMVFAVQVSSTPNFCGSCHIMKPYYDSWKTSGHRDIACVECHISPGITAEVRKKFEALSMVAKYFTGTYSTNPWAEVDDAACLRCHERRLLDGKELYRGVMFDHTPHLTESRRGLNLRCTSCHSQIVQGSHISVTPSTCALCHFKGEQTNEGTGACLTCHEIPDKVVTATGVTFDHGQVKRLDMSCTLCHGGAVRGDGNVPRERCLTCHNQPDRLEKFTDKDFLHRMHVTEHKVDCMNCHLQIEHGRTLAPGVTHSAGPEVAHGAGLGATGDSALAASGTATHAAAIAPGGDCRSCHGSGHSPQQDLYAGVGGRGVPRMPSPMFSAGVTCEGCHNSALSGGSTGGIPAMMASSDLEGIRTVRAGAVSCMSCHGPGYKSIYEQWQQALASRSGALRAQLDATAPAMGVAPPEAWEDARHNYLLVERGRGVHNVNFAFALLAKSHEQMNVARKARGQAALSRPWAVVGAGSERCLQCHTGIEAQSGTFAGREFSHRPHTEAAKLECAECHRPHEQRAPGEVVKFGATGCVPCHHRAAEAEEPACRKCHGDVRARTVKSFRGEFSHAAHLDQGLACATCHAGSSGDPRPPKSACADCHSGE